MSASTSIFAFKRSIGAFADEIGIDVALMTQKLAHDGWAGVTQKTPVDTGRARAGWGMTIGVQDLNDLGDLDTSGIDGQITVHFAEPSEPDFSAIDGKQVVYILNNVHYIVYLEDGSSSQAPNGMVKLTMAELEAELDTLLIK